MKILEINKFYNAKRGADKHFLDVIELLQENGHQIAAFSMKQPEMEYSTWEDYFLSEVGYGKSFSVWQKMKGVARMFHSFEAKQKINALLDEFEPDVVHIHNIYHQMSPTILFEIKKRNIPIFMTVHDWKLINPNHSLRLNGRPYRRCANGRYYQCFLDKCVKDSYAKSFLAMLEMYWHAKLGTYKKNIDCYIAPSNFVKNILVSWGVPAEKISVLPHFEPEKKDGQEYSFKVADKFALYAGKISKEKGVDRLIKIFKNFPDTRLYLAGELEDGFEIPANQNVVYLGFVKADQLREYMRNALCVVSASKLPETFGLIALEALSAGKPFVGFDRGAYGEIIENGKDGFIVRNSEKFENCLADIIKGKVVFDENLLKKRAEKYNAMEYYKQLMMLFEKSLAQAEMRND